MAERKRRSKTNTVSAVKRGPKDERGAVAEQILAAARLAFSLHGYAETSIRAVARAAGVDAALVSYYFTSKSGLLAATLEPPPGFFETVAQAASAPLVSRGAALVRAMLGMWDQPDKAAVLKSIILTAAHEPIAMARVREVFGAHVLGAVSAQLESAERQLRASLVASQMLGLAMTRYVWQIGALAQLPSERIVPLIAPNVQRYLAGKLS